MSQENFPLFSASIGERIRWLRSKRGLTLAQLGDGSASTAGSWEEGKLPRGDRWQGITERLGATWTFISTGVPTSEADYGILRQYRNEIQWKGAPENAVRALDTDEFSAGERSVFSSLDTLRRDIRARIEDTIRLAGDDVGKLGWIREQVIRHASAPEHWNIHEQVIKKVLADEKRDEEQAAARDQSTRAHGKAS